MSTVEFCLKEPQVKPQADPGSIPIRNFMHAAHSIESSPASQRRLVSQYCSNSRRIYTPIKVEYPCSVQTTVHGLGRPIFLSSPRVPTRKLQATLRRFESDEQESRRLWLMYLTIHRSSTATSELFQRYDTHCFTENDECLLMIRLFVILSHFHHLHTAASPSVPHEGIVCLHPEATISCSLAFRSLTSHCREWLQIMRFLGAIDTLEFEGFRQMMPSFLGISWYGQNIMIGFYGRCPLKIGSSGSGHNPTILLLLGTV